MKARDILRRAGRNLKQAKIRTLLTALAISVGAFTITLALAAGNGGRSYTDSLIQNNGDARSLTVFPKQPEQQQSDGPKEYGADDPAQVNQDLLSVSDVEKISKLEGVESVIPMYNISAEYMQGVNDKKYQTTLSIKVDQTGVELVAGSLKNNQPDPGKVIIPEAYVSSLGFANAEQAIGKSIMVRIVKQSANPLQASAEAKDMTFTVQAVDKESTTILRYQEAIRVSPSDGKAIYEYQAPAGQAEQYFSLIARAKSGYDPAAVQDKIKNAGYEVFSLKDVQELLFTFVNIVMYGAAGFGALAILASIFGIINTQYISVLERTQQIGLMKALGARRRDIGRLFRYEAAWVGFLGGFIGTVGASFLGLLNPWITKQLNLENGTELLKFDPIASIILVISLMLVAVIAGWFPSRKAAKLDPIEALRTE